jgi:hypothetical protein
MTTHRPEDFARQFPENGMKLLLHGPLNVRDLLRIARWKLVNTIDYDCLQLDPTTSVQRDYRHVETDIVLRAPLRRRRQQVILYLLLEHQSEPERLMPFRVHDYTMAIYRDQLRDWGRTHPSDRDFVFQPVLPVVFYTGTRPWPRLGTLADLVAGGPQLSALAPSLAPLFINLRKTSDAHLVSAGGSFGQVLRLVKQRHARRGGFRTLLEQVVRALEAMPDAERLRWLDLLSYIHALVYHGREKEEHAEMQARIAQSVQTDPHRQEVKKMGQTIAQMFEERGQLKSLRATLQRLIHRRFGEPPADVVATIEACGDIAQLDAWIDAIITARRLAELRIQPRS